MKTIALLRLIRPLNGIIGSISVFIGGLLTHQEVKNPHLFLACLICFIIISAGNGINDFVDVEVDKINNPNRAIVSRKCSRIEALIFSIALFIVGIGISIILGIWVFVITLSLSLLILLYNFNLKKKGLLGNFLIALLGGFPFIYGGIVLKAPIFTIIPFVFAFLLHFAREILKDIEDIPGDKEAKIISFPIKYGIQRAKILVIITLIVLIGVTFVPFLIHLYGKYYFIGVLVGINLPLGIIIYNLLRTETYISRASMVLKFSMLIGLIVLALGYYN